MARPVEFSDEAAKGKTGKSSDEWYEVIDDIGGKKIGHASIAKFLKQEHGLSGWWAQAITNRYEHSRKLRND